jgi:hypothetical protein
MTIHSSQFRMSGQLSSMSRIVYGHSLTELCWCRKGTPQLRIMSSLSTITCSIIWMVSCELWPRRRQNGWMSYNLPCSLYFRSHPYIIWKALQRLVSILFQQIPMNLDGSCNHCRSGTRDWIWIRKTWPPIVPKSMRQFGKMWRTNNAIMINDCRSRE